MSFFVASLLALAATSSVATSTSAGDSGSDPIEVGSSEDGFIDFGGGGDFVIPLPLGGDGLKLSLYGFLDFTFSKTFTGRRSLISDFIQRDSFAVGSFNFYLQAELSQRWHTLAEVRLMYAPHGTELLRFGEGKIELVDGSFFDVIGLSERRWGGIDIQRAYLEYEAHPLLTLRLGQWLTPYGIWNVDHGSPTILGVRTPFPVSLALFPERQTGLMVLGRVDFDALSIDYSVTLSNGRGLIDSYRDLDGNRAVGGRIAVVADGLGLTVGGSAYYGLYTNARREVAVEASYGSTAVRIDTVPVVQYDELSLAADVRWEANGFLVQAELIASQRAFTEEGRPGDDYGKPGLVADYTRIGGYGLVGYRTDYHGLTPFISLDHLSFGYPELLKSALGVSMGINVRPIAAVALKAQLSRYFFRTSTALSETDETMNFFETQAAWAF